MSKEEKIEKTKDDIKQVAQSSTDKEMITEKKEQIRQLEEKIKLASQTLLKGKSPIWLREDQGKIKWEYPILKDPHNSLSDVLKYLTATTDFELAAEIFDKGRNALPGTERPGRNANLALQSLADSSPRDATEARLCLQATALYSQGMHYLSRAEGSNMLFHSEFYMKCAIKLLRLHNETVDAISKYRRGGEQRVLVQHVNVNEGGQAIVGTINHGGGVNKKTDEVIP